MRQARVDAEHGDEKDEHREAEGQVAAVLGRGQAQGHQGQAEHQRQRHHFRGRSEHPEQLSPDELLGF